MALNDLLNLPGNGSRNGSFNSSGKPWILAQCGTLRVDRLKPFHPPSGFPLPVCVFIKLVGGKIIYCGFAMAYESLFSEMGFCQLCWKEGVAEFKAW